jgi:hypothetical protein
MWVRAHASVIILHAARKFSAQLFISPPVDRLAVPYICTLSLYSKIFGEKSYIEYKTCFFIFSTTFSATFLTLRKCQRYIITTVRRSVCEVNCPAGVFVRFSRQLNFPDRFAKNLQI